MAVSSTKAELIQELLGASRVLSTETVMFHAAIAETAGLSATESKATDYLARLGPLTPKELAQHSGLAPASVTALVDRLERKGVVQRKPHPTDRRKVLVELDEKRTDAMLPLWDYLVSATVEHCGKYSEDQLRAIIDFVTEGAAICHRATAKITSDG
jgi:DNA-binding MarR family transcriptional regulator